jgi:hypothetical protein
MRYHIGHALTVAARVAAVPIVILNFAVPIACVVWLIVLQHWAFLFAGLLTGVAAQVTFGVMMLFVPIIARSLLQDMNAAIYALKLFRAVLFFLQLFYGIYIFRLAMTEVHLSLWLRLAWAYAAVVTPFAWIGLRGRVTDPMLVVWPTAAAYGAIAAVIAFTVGAAQIAPAAQVCGSLVGLYFGSRLGMRRVFIRLRRPQPAY